MDIWNVVFTTYEGQHCMGFHWWPIQCQQMSCICSLSWTEGHSCGWSCLELPWPCWCADGAHSCSSDRKHLTWRRRWRSKKENHLAFYTWVGWSGGRARWSWQLVWCSSLAARHPRYSQSRCCFSWDLKVDRTRHCAICQSDDPD